MCIHYSVTVKTIERAGKRILSITIIINTIDPHQVPVVRRKTIDKTLKHMKYRG